MAEQRLQKILGRSVAIASGVGTVIGLGILRTPGEIAATISEPWIYMALWAGAALVSLITLSVIAELIALAPRSGGPYILVDRAFGAFPAFIIGWANWIVTCAVLALQAVVMMEFLALLVPAATPYQVAGAIAVTSIFAVSQLIGVRFTTGVQHVSAIFAGLVMVTVTILLIFANVSGLSDAATANPLAEAVDSSWKAYALAVSAIVIAYNGYAAPSFFNGEMKQGTGATISGAFRGLYIVIALYLLVNAAIVISIPFSALQGHELALAGALEGVYGSGVGAALTICAIIILFGHQNIGYMLSCRVLYALSVNGYGYGGAKRVTAMGTPSVAVLISWGLTVALILVGGFGFLLSFASIIMLFHYAVLMAGVIRLRITEPDTPRSYQSPGYPWIAIFMTVFWAAVAIFIAVIRPDSTLSALGMIAVSVPVYLWLNSRPKLAPASK